MKKRSNRILIALLLFVLTVVHISCKPELKSRNDIQKYINDPANGLSSSFQKEEVEVNLSWQPWQFLNPKFKPDHSDTVQKDSSNLSQNYYFILSLSKNKQELLRQLDYNLYSKMVQLFSFQMPSYITIKGDKSESIKPLDCLFQQTYGTTDANRLLIVFSKSEVKGAEKLIITIREFGLGLGIMDFIIYTKNMRAVDQLNVKTIKNQP